MKQVVSEVYKGFKDGPLAMLCVLLVGAFIWVYNDMREINAEQRQFMGKLHESQVLMSESLKELNVRMSNIESNFKTTPDQLKELIMLLHKSELNNEQ